MAILSEGRKTIGLVLVLILLVMAAFQLIAHNYTRPSDSQVETVIQRGVLFLEQAQLPSGEFSDSICLVERPTGNIESCVPDSTPFVSSFVIHSLATIDEMSVLEMRNKSLSFILENKREGYIWGYWSYRASKYNTQDNDIDDTSVALVAMKEMGMDVETQWFLLNNTDPEGLFYTWFSEKNQENDIDCVVNANVLFYFALENYTDEKVCNYLKKIVEEQTFPNCSVYYPSGYAFTYALTRTYSDGHQNCLEEIVPDLKDYLIKRQKSDGSFGDELETALATASLLNLNYTGPETSRAINHIIKTQQEDGGWPLRIFYSNVNQAGPDWIGFGSRELTTAISLEALSKYRKK